MATRILIVEDEYLIAVEMAFVIEELGHECAGIADDTQSAMALATNDIDVALVDVNLNDGPTGPVIGKTLAEQHGIAVIFVTANPQQLGSGVSGTLGAVTKPVEVETLHRVLDYVLSSLKGEATNADPPRGLKKFN